MRSSASSTGRISAWPSAPRLAIKEGVAMPQMVA
jgi:hypothetical protein